MIPSNRYSRVLGAPFGGTWPCETGHATTGSWKDWILYRGRSDSAVATVLHPIQTADVFLIDTDVLSALRRRKRNPEIARWLAAQRTTDLHLSVVSIGEIERGIAGVKCRDSAFAERLEEWLDALLRIYGDRVLTVDLSVARRWVRLSEEMRHNGADLLIAATALEHGLTVVTRNTRDFAAAGVPVLDPSTPRSAPASPPASGSPSAPASPSASGSPSAPASPPAS